jgi:hypothetical protein
MCVCACVSSRNLIYESTYIRVGLLGHITILLTLIISILCVLNCTYVFPFRSSHSSFITYIMFTQCPYIEYLLSLLLLLLLLSGNVHGNKYVVLGWLPGSSQKHESFQHESSFRDYPQLVHVRHEREVEKEGESAV